MQLCQIENEYLRFLALIENQATFVNKFGTVTYLKADTVQCYLAARYVNINIASWYDSVLNSLAAIHQRSEYLCIGMNFYGSIRAIRRSNQS